jgi:hypothetical protein
MRTLRLASPFMRGNDVRMAQNALVKRGYLPPVSVDGVYGPATANAAKAAKCDVGYQRKNVTTTYGAVLHAYLTGKRNPSRAMRIRARARRRNADRSIGAKAAATMTTWATNGWKEYPAGSNRVPQLSAAGKALGVGSYYYNMGYPWCAYATFIAALTHGSVAARDGFAGRFNVLYTPTIRQVAENGSYGCKAVARSAITRGTFVLFDFGGSNGGEVDHIGIALARPGHSITAANRRWQPGPDEIVCAEGNTSLEGQSGSQSNGGACAIRIRKMSQIRTAFTIR